MKISHLFFVIGCTILSFNLLKAQQEIILDKIILKDSYLSLKEKLNSQKKWHTFLLENGFERVYSDDFSDDLYQVLNKLDLPNNFGLLEKIRVIKCHFNTEGFAYWYIIMINKDLHHYYFSYEDNSGIEKIPLVGIVTKEDYIWKTANMLLQNRTEKSKDYMVCAEIEDNNFLLITASQTFHISDNAILRMMLELIKM